MDCLKTDVYDPQRMDLNDLGVLFDNVYKIIPAKHQYFVVTMIM